MMSDRPNYIVICTPRGSYGFQGNPQPTVVIHSLFCHSLVTSYSLIIGAPSILLPAVLSLYMVTVTRTRNQAVQVENSLAPK